MIIILITVSEEGFGVLELQLFECTFLVGAIDHQL